MTTVTIDCSVPCGFREQAQRVQTILLERLGRDLESFSLQSRYGGVFRVDVDGETVWDEAVHGMDPDVDAIADAVEGTERAATAEGTA